MKISKVKIQNYSLIFKKLFQFKLMNNLIYLWLKDLKINFQVTNSFIKIILVILII
jgi:hypothetical protein